nr:hypothetical protein CFP56_17618 [Quercus suber]
MDSNFIERLQRVSLTEEEGEVLVWGLPFDLINEEAGRDIGRGLAESLRWTPKLLHLTRHVFFGSKSRCRWTNQFAEGLLCLVRKVIRFGWPSNMNVSWGYVSIVVYLVMRQNHAPTQLCRMGRRFHMENG